MSSNVKINSRNKGKSGELEFIKEFEIVFGVKLKRNYEQAASSGHDFIVDKLDSALAKYIDEYYAIEAKRRKKIKQSDLNKFWEQAVKQAKKAKKIPILVYREDYRMWRVLFPLLWNSDKTINGTADMSLIGLYKWLKVIA